MTTEMMEKINALCSNEAFADSLAEAETDQQVLDLFAENGVAFTPGDLAEINGTCEADGELSEDEMEGVAGGVIINPLLRLIWGKSKKKDKKNKNGLPWILIL